MSATVSPEHMTPVYDEVSWPTREMTTAHNLRQQQGKSDVEVAEIMGVHRVTACRLRSQYRRCVATLQRHFASRGVPFPEDRLLS